MSTNIGQDLANVPFAEMVYQLGSAIANAQTELDFNSIEILKKMGDVENYPVDLPVFNIEDEGKFADGTLTTSMIGAGFQPTFYQFAESIIEIKMTITASTEDTTEKKEQGTVKTKTTTKRGLFGLRKSTKVVSTPINATYTSKYNYQAEGSSLLRTRLVPVPPNTMLQKIIDLKAQYLSLKYDAQIKAMELELANAQENNDSPDTTPTQG
jgi:hypothetical protein